MKYLRRVKRSWCYESAEESSLKFELAALLHEFRKKKEKPDRIIILSFLDETYRIWFQFKSPYKNGISKRTHLHTIPIAAYKNTKSPNRFSHGAMRSEEMCRRR